MNKLAKQAGLFLGLSASWALAIEVPDWPLELEDQPGERLVLLHVSKEHAMYESAFNNVSLTQTGTDWEYPKVESQFNPRNEYRGYFNSYLCYQYDRANNGFVIHGLVKPPLTTQEAINSGDGLNNNSDPDDDIELIGYYYCNSGSADESAPAYNPDGLWSGNYLNYISMSRMDLVRFQLYGGKEPTDGFSLSSITGTDDESVAPIALERAQIPPDSHGWTIGYNLNSSRFVVGDASGEINADPDNNPESVCYPEDPTKDYDIDENPIPSYQECNPENSDNGSFTQIVDNNGDPVESDDLNEAWNFDNYVPITQEEYEEKFLKVSNTWRLSHLTPFKDPDGTNHTLFANATVRAFSNNTPMTPAEIQTTADVTSLRVDDPEDRYPTLRVLANTPHNAWQWGSVPAPMYEGRCWVANAGSGSGYSVDACDAGDGFYDFRVRLEVDCAREKALVEKFVDDTKSSINDAIEAVQDAEEALLKAEDELEFYERQKDILCGENGIDNTETKTTLDALLALKEDLLTQIAADNNPANAYATLQEELIRVSLDNVNAIVNISPAPDTQSAPFAGAIAIVEPRTGLAQTVFDELTAYKNKLINDAGVDILAVNDSLALTAFEGLQDAVVTALENYRAEVNGLGVDMIDGGGGNIRRIRNRQADLWRAKNNLQTWLTTQKNALAAVTPADTAYSIAAAALQTAQDDKAALEQDIADAPADKAAAETAKAAAEAEKTAAEAAKTTALADKTAAEDDLMNATTQAEIDAANAAIADADSRISAADTTISNANTTISNADSEIDAADNLINNEATLLAAAQDEVDDAQDEVNDAPGDGTLPDFDANHTTVGGYWGDPARAPQQMIAAGNEIVRTNLRNWNQLGLPNFNASQFTPPNYVGCEHESGDVTDPEVTPEGPVDGSVEPGSCPANNASTDATTTAATGLPGSITAIAGPTIAGWSEERKRQWRAMWRLQQLARLQTMIDDQQDAYDDQVAACGDVTNKAANLTNQINNSGGLQEGFDDANSNLNLANEQFRNTARRDIKFTRACAGNNVTGLVRQSGFNWGLMTTSYSNPDQGGVLRLKIGSTEAQLKYVVNNLRVASSAGSANDNGGVNSVFYNQDCITPGNTPLADWSERGNCHNIADPNAEYLLEGLRYFSGEEDFRDKAGQAGVTDPGEDTRATPTNDFYNNGNGSNTVDTEYYVDFMGISVELPVAEEERNGQRWWTSDPIEEYGACSESMQLVYNVAGSSFDNDDIFNIDIPDPQDPYTTWNLVKSGDFGKTAVAQIEKSNVLIGASGADYVSFKFKNKDMHGQYRKGISSGGSYYVADITKHFDGLSGDVHNVYEDEEDGVRGEPSADCQGSAGQNNDGCSEDLVDPLADIQGVRLMAVEAQHTLPRIRIPKKPLEEMDLSQADGEVIDEEGNTENAKNSSEYRKNSLFKEALADEYIEFIPVAQTQFGGDTYNPTNRIAAFEMVYEYNTREGFTNDGEPLIIDDQFYNKFTDEGRLDFDFEDAIGNPTIPRLVYDNLRLLAPSNMDESINEGRPAMQFIVTYNEQEAGSNFEGNFVVKYTIRVNADEKLDVIVEPLAASTSNNVKAGYIMAHADTESLQLVVDSSTMTTASTDPTPDDETDAVDSGYAFLTTDTEAFLRSPLWHAVEAGQPNRKQNYYVLHNITHEGLDYMLDNMNVNTVAPSSNFNCENGRRYLQSSTAPTSAVTGEFTYSFTAWFDFCGWAGDLRVYRIDEYGFMRGVRNGDEYTDEPFWSAGELLNKYYGASSHGARNVQFLSQPEDAEGSIIRGPAAFSAGNVLSSPLMKNKLLTDRVQSAVLGGDDSYVSSLANWLRGDDSNETDKGGAFRPRKALSGSNYSDAENNILGDIYGSSLVYVGAPTDLARNSQQPGYKNFYDGNKNRRKMVYVGANDGMVHAFDALTGEEIYALVLNSTANKISRIATPGYDCNNQRRRRFDLFEYSDADCHKFLVDGKQVAADVQINNEWKTVLVGTTGRGGRGLYAIDITNPGEIGDSPSSPNGITAMWEIEGGKQGTDYENLYYTFPEPTITQLSDGTWVVVMANGYDDAQGTGDSTSVQDGEEGSVASLFLINIEDGSLVDEIILDPGRAITDRPQGLRPAITAGEANGLSTPLVLDYFVGSSNDIGSDGKADTIYAGDLYGNLYRIDVRLPTSLNHSTVFTTMEDDNKVRQAITSKPLAKRFNYAPESGDLQDGVLIFVGTGKFLERSDDLSGVTNSFYAIFDDPASISSDTLTRANLLERKLSKNTCQNSSQPTKNPLCTPDNPKTTQIDGEEVFVFADEREKTDWRGTNKSGWYINLFERGERIINNGFFVGDQVSFYAITPSFSICVAGGKSYAYVFEWETGLTPNDNTTFVTSTDNAVNEDGNTGAVRKWIANTIITNYSIVRTNNVVQFFGSSAGKDLNDVVSKVDPEDANTQLGSVCTINSKGECVLTDVEDAYEIGQTPGGGGTLGGATVGGGLACDVGSVCHMLKNPAAGQANWIRVYRP